MADAQLVESFRQKILYAPTYVLPSDATPDMVEAYEIAKGIRMDTEKPVESGAPVKAKAKKKAKKG